MRSILGLILCDCYVIKFPKFKLRQTRLRTNYRHTEISWFCWRGLIDYDWQKSTTEVYLHTWIFYLEFEAIEWDADLNSLALTPQRWVEQKHAEGLVTKQGHNATFTHKEIAFEFASFITAEVK